MYAWTVKTSLLGEAEQTGLTLAVLAVRSQVEAHGAGAVVGARGVLTGLGTQPARIAPALIYICQCKSRSY